MLMGRAMHRSGTHIRSLWNLDGEEQLGSRSTRGTVDRAKHVDREAGSTERLPEPEPTALDIASA